MGSISNIKPIFTQVGITEDKINAKEVVLPTGFKLMESKPVTSKGLEKVSVIQTRHTPVYSSGIQKNNGVVEQNNGVVEPVETTNLNENIISLIETTLSKTQKEELLHICNDDWNIITPLLVKEYLWRKKNKKSVKNIVQEVQAYENISSIPQEDLEKYLKSQNLASVIEHKTGVVEQKNGVVEHKTGVVEPVETTNHKENVISLIETKLTKKQKEELLHICNDDTNLITPLLVKEYLSRKENKKSLENIVQEVQNLNNVSSINKPIVKLTTVEKQHFKMDYGLPTEGLSPVIKDYIQSGEWKNNRFGNVDGVTTSVNGVFENVNGTSTSENGVPANVNGITKGASGIVTGGSGIKNTSSAIKVSNTKTEHISVDEPYSMSSELKETIREVSRTRRNVSRKTDTKDYIDSSINAVTNAMSPEEIRMARINANYEHDKAVLAKTDPAFAAKNQFWDVGHAEDEEKKKKKVDETKVKHDTEWVESEISKKAKEKLEL